MKKLITNYTFDASAKQVVFTDYNPVSLAGILVITNVTDNIIIYNFADSTLGGTVATTTLTLAYNTTTMDDTDKLQIWYDDGVGTVGVTGTIAATQSGTWDEVGINDSGNSITVDGTVTANAGTNLNTSALAIETGGNLAAMNAKLVTGTDIGDVTINNSTGAAAVNIQDGGNAITVDGTVTAAQATAANLNMTEASGAAIKTAVEALDNSVDGNYLNTNMNIAGTDVAGGNGTVSAQTQRVTLASDSTGQVKLAASSGVDIGKLTANQSVNVAQMNGVTTLMGAGNDGTGAQRVTISTDQVAVASKAAINTYVDGSIVTIGAKADAKSTATDTTAVTLMQVTKQISASVQAPPYAGVEDAAETAGGSLAMAGSVRRDTAASSAGATGDNATLNTDSTGGLYVTHNITTIGHGVKTVTTAGTDLALAASTACKKVDIQAQTDNTSIIAVGGSGVDAVVATGTGIVLNPGDTYSLEIDNLADVFIDSLVNGEGVRFTYYT